MSITYRGKDANVLAWLGVAFVVAISCYTNAITLEDRNALGGWSPIDWVNHLFLPENFAADYKSGIETYRYSLFMHLYPALVHWFDVPVDTSIYWVLCIEIVSISAAVAYLTRALLPTAGPAIVAIAAILIIASSLGLGDLSRSSVKPFFWGLYYNVADATRLLAIALVLQRRFLIAAVLLAFSISTHPIMGALGAAFITIGFFGGAGGEYRRRDALVANILCIALAGVWIIGGIGQSVQSVVLSDNTIPKDEWLAFATAMNYHWFPHAFGTLTDFHGQHLLSLLGYVVLFFHYLPKCGLSDEVERAWRWGVLGLLALTVLGITFSIWLPEPFLVKLNLLRASALVLWVGLPVVVTGLVNDVLRGIWFARIAAGVILLAPFLGVVAPPLAVMLVAGPDVLSAVRHWSSVGAGKRIAIAVFLAVFALVACYILFSVHFDQNRIHYTAQMIVWKAALVAAAMVWIVDHYFGNRRAELVLLVVTTLAAAWWVNNDYRAASADHDRALAYREVQDWARTSTPRDALFLVDPLIMYGWRDYSQRSSFGNLREWLHTSWLYESNAERYREGKKRFNELGIDPTPYFALRPTSTRMSAFYSDVGRRFYELGDDWRRDIASRYSVSYFVMERSKLGPSSLPVVFENKQFVVLKPG